MEFVFGSSSASMGAKSEAERSLADRKRRKGAIDVDGLEGEGIHDVWMERRKEEGPKVNQLPYKDSLLRNLAPAWSDLDDEGGEKEGRITTGFDDVEEPSRGISVDMSDPLCPRILLDEAERERLLRPFRRTLIVKLLGATPNYEFLRRRFSQMWAKAGDIRVFDLPNDFYLVKFKSQDDYEVALTEGPWIIAGSYLSVMQWRANFNPKTEVVDRVIAWVRLPELPAIHYDKKFLFNLGNVLGKAIKVDIPTAQRGRGKFARLCVELDLSKPLVPQFSIDGLIQPIEYECMNLLCLHCGRVGHMRDKYEEMLKAHKENVERENMMKDQGNMSINEEIEEEPCGESQWRVV